MRASARSRSAVFFALGHSSVVVIAAALSVIVAALVGGVEALGLVAGKLGLAGGMWDAVIAANDNLGTLGYVIVAIFVASWAISVVAYRLMGYDKISSA